MSGLQPCVMAAFWRCRGGPARRCGHPVRVYGDLFRPAGRMLGPGDPWLTPADATEFDQELLVAWWRAAAESDPRVIDPDARTLARTPGSVQAALRALSGSAFFTGLAERAMLSDLQQVRREDRAHIDARRVDEDWQLAEQLTKPDYWALTCAGAPAAGHFRSGFRGLHAGAYGPPRHR